ncbi:MAG: monophosphatase [Clostridia bacterium]|nr:monophosphatase [Clostridia bacterium]
MLNERQLLDWGCSVLAETADYIRRLIQEEFELHTRLSAVNPSGDMMTAFDAAVNARIRQILQESQRELPCVLISEETGVEFLHRCPEYFFLLDPVDGSTNIRPYLTPAPHLSMSLGMGYLKDLEAVKTPEAIRVSIHREIFGEQVYYAVSGQGAYIKFGRFHKKIHSSPLESLGERSVIGLDLDECHQLPAGVKALLERGIIQRRLGSSILDFCQVACGQYDAYISPMGRLKITDVCQSYHLVREAGGEFGYELLRNGERDPALAQDFLYRVLSEENLLKEVRFRLIAAGTARLKEELESLLGYRSATPGAGCEAGG